MTARVCAGCREAFGPLRPPVSPVTLREGQPGATVPRLQITMLGSLCGACARARIARRRRK